MTPGCVKHVLSDLILLGSAPAAAAEAAAFPDDVALLSSTSVTFRYAVAYSGTSGASFYACEQFSYNLIELRTHHIHRNKQSNYYQNSGRLS